MAKQWETKLNTGALFPQKRDPENKSVGNVNIAGTIYTAFGEFDRDEDAVNVDLLENNAKVASLKLSVNDKGGIESRPDRRGIVHVQNGAWEVVAWKKTYGPHRKTMLSLSIQRKESRPEPEDVPEEERPF